MKKLLSILLSAAMLAGMTAVPAAVSADEVTQTVLKTMVDDEKHNFCGQCLNSGEYGTPVEGMTTDLSYNGTKSYKFESEKATVRYMEWLENSDGTWMTIADGNEKVAEAINNGTAYICGWFYAEKGEMSKTIQLISEGADTSETVSIPNEQWTYITAKIDNLKKGMATNGCIDTNGAGAVYVDDLCVVSTSDGSVPAAPARESAAKPGSEPNRYTKVLREIYTDGFVHGWRNANSAITAEDDTTFYKSGSQALKFTGELQCGYRDDNNRVCTLGSISDELTEAVKAGKVYWTAWAYIDTVTTDVMGQTLDFYLPTNPRTRGEWTWICKQLTESDLASNNMYIKSKGVYTWLDDVKLVTFEDLPDGINYDEYLINGIADNTSVTSGSKISVKASLYNNSVKTKNMSVIFAERNQAGKLVSATISDVGKALPFREYAFNCEYTVSKTIGNTVKIMLWNMEEINPLQEAKEFVIKEVPHEPEYAKVLREIYTDGFVHGWRNTNNAITAEDDTTFYKSGSQALKFTGELQCGYRDDNNKVCTLGSISDELTEAVKAGKVYWTAWAYIDTVTTDVMGQTLDFYLPTNPRTRGEWTWICKQLTESDLTSNNMYIKSKGVYTWLDDVKLVTFE